MNIDKNLLKVAEIIEEDRIKKTFSSVIYSSDGKEYKINTRILEENKVPKDNYVKIADIYQKIEEMFKKSRRIKKVEKIHSLIEEMKTLEFELQGLWGFEKDEDKHRYWKQLTSRIK